MRTSLLYPALLFLALASPAAVQAGDAPECLDYEAEYRAAMEVVKARAPGLETDQKRDKARERFEACEREERIRNSRTTICSFVNGDRICHTE